MLEFHPANLTESPKLFETIAEQVARVDPHMAVDWIQDFPEEEIRDGAIKSVIMQIADRFPEESKQLAQSIENVQMREQALERVLMANRFNTVKKELP